MRKIERMKMLIFTSLFIVCTANAQEQGPAGTPPSSPPSMAGAPAPMPTRPMQGSPVDMRRAMEEAERMAKDPAFQERMNAVRAQQQQQGQAPNQPPGYPPPGYAQPPAPVTTGAPNAPAGTDKAAE